MGKYSCPCLRPRTTGKRIRLPMPPHFIFHSNSPTNRAAVSQPTKPINIFFLQRKPVERPTGHCTLQIAAWLSDKNPVSTEGSPVRFTPSGKPARRNNGSARPFVFDSLESRLLLAATDYAFLTGTALTIRGGDAASADVITLAKSGTDLSVTIDVSSDFLGAGDLPAFTLTFPSAAITSINLQSGGAVDILNINGLF